MDSDEGKLFIGGIAWDTTEDSLRDHFARYGDVSQSVIMRDKTTGRPRGFGFVVFSDPSLLERVLQDKHTIDGRTVEAKRALSREEQYSSFRSGNITAGSRGSGGGGNYKTKKIFVGGLPSSLTEDGFRQYFENYGHVTDVVVMYDQNTQRPRGFGFITFDSEDAVDEVLHKTFHELNGKLVEVKRALPKDVIPGSGNNGHGGSYGANSSPGDVRTDGGRYMQHQNSPSGYPPYSAYGSQSYAYYGPASGIGYGGYACYPVAGFGNGNAGYSGPTEAYGMPGVLKNAWSSQSPSGYGTIAGYVPTAPWSAPGGVNYASSHMGQSHAATSGYQTPGYGYGNYGGNDGRHSGNYRSAGNAPNGSAGKGANAGELQGTEGGYDDTNRNSGCVNEGWRLDSSQASVGYGGGHCNSHSRQAPQE